MNLPDKHFFVRNFRDPERGADLYVKSTASGTDNARLEIHRLYDVSIAPLYAAGANHRWQQFGHIARSGIPSRGSGAGCTGS
jgi:hypothetical protein